MRSAGWPVRQVDDCLAGIEPWLDSFPADVQPVLFNSWVLTCIEPDTRRRLVGALHTLVQRRGLTWLSAEGPWLKMGPAAPPQPGDAPGQRCRIGQRHAVVVDVAGCALGKPAPAQRRAVGAQPRTWAMAGLGRIIPRWTAPPDLPLRVGPSRKDAGSTGSVQGG